MLDIKRDQRSDRDQRYIYIHIYIYISERERREKSRQMTYESCSLYGTHCPHQGDTGFCCGDHSVRHSFSQEGRETRQKRSMNKDDQQGMGVDIPKQTKNIRYTSPCSRSPFLCYTMMCLHVGRHQRACKHDDTGLPIIQHMVSKHLLLHSNPTLYEQGGEGNVMMILYPLCTMIFPPTWDMMMLLGLLGLLMLLITSAQL